MDLFGSSPSPASPRSPASPASPASPRAPKTRRLQQATLARIAKSHRPEKVLYARRPVYLDLESEPFEEKRFLSRYTPLETNTVRWRYGRDAAGGVAHLSNARLVEYDDGSLTLQVGGEQFVVRCDKQAEPTFVAASTGPAEAPLLSTVYVVDETLALVPTSTQSASHKRLAEAQRQRQRHSGVHIGNVATRDDPERLQREVERAEQAKDKWRRKLAAKRAEEVVPHHVESPVEEHDDEVVVPDEESSDDERAGRLEAAKEGRRARVLSDEDDED